MELPSVTIPAVMDDDTLTDNPDNESLSEAYLHVQRGPLAGTVIPLQPGANIFGREEGYILPDEHVSRRHARIMAVSGEYLLTDLGSTNGTVVNGQRIKGATVLQHGDIIQLGGTLMVFYIRGMQGNIVSGTGASTPAADPDQLSENTVLITKNSRAQ